MLISVSDIPIDSMDIIVQRASAVLQSTLESSGLSEEKSEFTCCIGSAFNRSASNAAQDAPDELCCHTEEKTRAFTMEEWLSARRQYAQALILFCGADAAHSVCSLDVVFSRLLGDGPLLLNAEFLGSQDVLEDFRNEFTCRIWRAALRWLATIVVTRKLPEIEVFDEQELRLDFWEAQLEDGGEFPLNP